MGEGKRKGVFYLHAGGKLSRSLLLIELEEGEILLIGFIIPVVIKGLCDCGNALYFLIGIIIDTTLYITDSLLDFKFMSVEIKIEKANFATVRMNEVEQGV